MKKSIALALTGLFCATAAHAFEVTGGSVSLGYSGLTDGDLNDFNKTTLGGSLEFGVSQAFSLQGDLSLSKFGMTEDAAAVLGVSKIDSRSLGMHAIYHASENTSVGAFLGTDRIESTDLNFIGVEAGHQMGQFGLEGYLSRGKLEGITGTVLGLEGNYAVGEYTTLGLRYDNIDIEGFDSSRLSLTGEIGATPGFAVTGEIGNADLEDIGSELFMGIGVRVNFGAKRGATFRDRSVANLLPGG